MIVKPITGLAKLILVSALALMLVILETAGLVLSPLAPLHKLYHRFISAILVRLILGLLGFFWIKHEVVTLKRGYDPVFTQIYPSTLTVRKISFWEALRLSGSYPEMSPPEGVETMPLLEFVKAMHKTGAGPVVIFPEGTTTNNRAILKFVPIFKDCSLPETSINISILALKYDYHKFAPTFTVRLDNSYFFGHLFRTCAQFYNTLTVKSLTREESPSNAHFSALDGLSSTPSGAAMGAVEPVEDDPLGGVIINLMGRLTRFRKLGLNVQDKADFLEYYIQRNSGIRNSKAVAQKASASSASGTSRSRKH
ncbi:hypothetical protein BGZ58_002024 [Dissophora ornata]|nr:hypothetical protein BGZ58_002024 [Dissophora ornata]